MHIAFLSFSIDKSTTEPVYVQLGDQIILLLKKGSLQAGERLPGTRQLAELLVIHRKTVIRVYDELIAQGWLESRIGSGTFAARHLPEPKPQQLNNLITAVTDPLKNAGFSFDTFPHLNMELQKPATRFHLDDGIPDARLAPLTDLSRAYRSQLLLGDPYIKLGYNNPQGSLWLREELCSYLKETRGLNITTANILITRGAVMGAYLCCTGLLKAGDNVVTTEMSWTTADVNFIQAGAQLLRIPADEYGIRTDQLEVLCRKSTIRMVYVTSHHHYPTTVALRADRRLHLLQLSEKYGFILFEDDYDYDFHYQNKPLLPLASADQTETVIYCGSFTKAIAPAFRVGYLVASADVIHHLSQLRRIVDRQGDTMLENAVAELLQNGIIQRHLRKSLRVYRQRRDLFCNLMKNLLPDYTEFEIPEGGMAVWTKFDPQINLNNLAERALKKDLYFAAGITEKPVLITNNATRLGFASSTETELIQSVEILAGLLKN